MIFAWRCAFAADTLESLMDEAKYQQAYELGLSQMPERAGEHEFDFLFGFAAIEIGRPQEAVFALERALADIPEDHRARLELGRAYFMLGNFEQAEKHFKEVLAVNPPPQVQENIAVFLEQISDRSKGRDEQFSMSAEMKIGLDSNINSATEVTTVQLPIGLILSLGDTSREISDEFLEINLSASYLKLLRKDMGWFAAASLNEHQNASISIFDLRVTSLSGGFIYKSGKTSFRLPLQWQLMEVDRNKYRISSGLGLEYGYQPAKTQQVTLFGQYAEQRHIEAQKLRDVDLTLFGAAYGYDLPQLKVKLSASAYFADEKPLGYAQNHNGREYTGLRLGVNWVPQPQHDLQLSVTQQTVEHDEIHPAFGKIREDDYSQVSLDWGWRFDPAWRLGLAFSHTTNDSNLTIYTYGRTQQYLSLKYNF
jgi:tetratricopeptide (TPR) repeat protein